MPLAASARSADEELAVAPRERAGASPMRTPALKARSNAPLVRLGEPSRLELLELLRYAPRALGAGRVAEGDGLQTASVVRTATLGLSFS
mmetsp:Transcript_14586/g.34696  ORF Transcript_14586/g.34696 Transcript_14586/m.34696 type:complete len:90 (+) Transcript_14586:1352-1621(+)